MNEELAKEILAMVEEDQQMRKSHKWDFTVDERNTKRMQEIIGQYGWPGKSLVGQEASNGVWLLAQHADRNVEFQKQMLALMEGAVKQGEAEKKYLAYLIDRVKVNTGGLQVFGTQFFTDEHGVFGPRPIEDRANLDKRRKEFGLELFEQYEHGMQGINKEFQKKRKAKLTY